MNSKRFNDADAAILAGLSANLERDYESRAAAAAAAAMWRDSPFGWIRAYTSRTKGAIGEALVADWCKAQDFAVARSRDSDADRVIRGHRVEIKFSMLWTGEPIYKFQQIRDQNYDYCFCLGLSPFAAHAWFIPKHALWQGQHDGLLSQHGGKSGSETKWLSFAADDPPKWLKDCGGSLSQVAKRIRDAGIGGATNS